MNREELRWLVANVNQFTTREGLLMHFRAVARALEQAYDELESRGKDVQ